MSIVAWWVRWVASYFSLKSLLNTNTVNNQRFTAHDPELQLWFSILAINTTLATLAMISGFFGILAPYGSEAKQPSKLPDWMWGPKINSKLGWYIMEVPALLVALGTVLYFDLDAYFNAPTHCQFAVGCFVIHYVNRGIVFPSKRGHSTSMESSLTFLLGAFFNAGNAYTIVRYLSHFGVGRGTPLTDASTLRIGVASVVFFAGVGINMISDELLFEFSKRKKSETNKKVKQRMVPAGFFIFDYVTAGNYFGELLEWFGFYLLTSPSPASACFLYMTFCNLAPRAWSRHQRYIRDVKGYKELNRCAIIPFVL